MLSTLKNAPEIRQILGNRYSYHDGKGDRIGTLAFTDEGRRICIQSLKSKIRGTGLGTDCIEAIKKVADKRGISVLIEWMLPDAVSYWKKMGFRTFTEHATPRNAGYAIYP